MPRSSAILSRCTARKRKAIDSLVPGAVESYNASHPVARQDIPADFAEFNRWLGLPLDYAGNEAELLPFQLNVDQKIKENRHVIINKFTGAAMTEMIPRTMLHIMLAEKPYLKQFAIVTGIRMRLTVQEIEERIIPVIRQKHPELISSWNRTDATLRLKTGHYIKGYPTGNIDSIRGQNDLSFIFIDEAAFFPQLDQESVYNAIHRYDLKTNPRIVWNSTPNGPQGGYYKIWEDASRGQNDFYRVMIPYTDGLGTFLDPAVAEAKKRDDPRMFEQEYNNKFVAPEGAVMPEITTSDREAIEL